MGPYCEIIGNEESMVYITTPA